MKVLVILAVTVDEAGAEVVTPFMQKHKLSFSALLDTEGAKIAFTSDRGS